MRKMMRKNKKRWTSTILVAILFVSTFLPSGLNSRAHADTVNHVVISQYFGGGGNSGAPYNKDFIELYNPTDFAVSLDGWSVQYASASGTTWQVTTLSGSIQSHGYYLITEAGGATGANLPAPDASGALTMSASAAKVALFDKTTAASGSIPTGAIDFVGMGTANAFEGSGAAKALSNTTSAQRRPYANVDPAPGKGNAWDTDDNAGDFYTGAVAAPRNTASPAEAPMVPVISLQPNGNYIQFLQQGTSGTVTGGANAVSGNSELKAYESATKGVSIGTAIAASDGSFTLNVTPSKTLTSIFVAATQTGMAESTAIEISLATASANVVQAKLSYAITNGVGTLIGNTGAAVANSVISVYPNATATKSEKLNAQEIKAGTSGDFTATINNAPDTVYVTQQSSSGKGIMLESVPVAISKADTTIVSALADVRASDAKGQPINLNKFFTVIGVATVDNQILGTQKQNFYVQDDTAGINIFSTTFDTGYSVVKGDKLKITGRVLYYNGLTEFEPTAIEKISEGNPVPTAKSLSILDLNTYAVAEPLEGSLVTVTGKVSATASTPPNYNVTFVDESNKATTLRIMSKTGIVPDSDLVIGKSYTVTGVLGQYTTNATATSGYQIYPRDKKDVSPILSITHTPLTQVYKDINVEFVATAEGADSVTVYYRAIGATDFTALPMGIGSESRYTGTLDATNVPLNGFEYYIEAKQGAFVQSAGSTAAPYPVTVIDDKVGPTFSGETPQSGTKIESPHPEISVLINDPSGVDETSLQMWFDGQELNAPVATLNRSQVKYIPEQDLTLGVHTVKVIAKDTLGNTSEKQWTFEIVPRFTGGHHYRGTTHNHTNISHDASGTPEDALKAGKAHHYDWFAFSDHSHDIDPSLLGQDTVDHKGMPERTGGTQWQSTKDLAKQYTQDGDYVVFPAFEMTSTTWGHSNIFGTDNFIDRNINGKQYQDLNKYYAWVMTYDNIVGQFNHPDMSANAFNNFKPYNKDVDKLFTMLEVGNGSGHYGYANAETKFYSALDLGWHVAPTYGEDNHEGTWGQINNRTVIVADNLSQDSLLQSMRNMRVYMEEDPNFTLDVLANGYYMGSTVDSKTLNFNISGSDLVAESHSDSDYSYLPATYKSDDQIAKVELISSGGKVVDSITPMTKDFNWTPTYTVSSGQQWFVVKVTQMDGERIYSAPIWSKEQPVDVKVNAIDVVGDVIVGGNPATLKATIANNGTETVKNLKVDFYYDSVSQDHFIGTNTISSILSKSSATATALWSSPIKGDHQLIAVVTSNDGLDIGDVKFLLPIKIKEPLGIKVLIDAAHGNENTSTDGGTYKDNLKSFTLLLQKEGYKVVENTQAITDAILSDVQVLMLTHPKTALTVDERAAVAKFVKNGGSILLTGKSNNSVDPTINNPLLSEIGTGIRINNDGVFDDTKTGNFWGDPKLSPYAVRLHPGLVSNYITDRVPALDYYSGSSLAGENNQPLAAAGKVVIIGKGNETTYQGNLKGSAYTYDNVSDATGGSSIPLIASEEIGASGRVIVSGMNVFNDKQMDQSFEPKGNVQFSLNAVNWLAHRETKIANISDVRKMADDTEAVIEGTVTTGAGVFFDAFYIQDATGGIMAYMEVPEGSLKPGDKVRVYGHLKTFENNKEFEFNKFDLDVIKLGAGTPILAKEVATGNATSEENQGQLVKVTGKIVSKYDENSYVIDDGSGPTLVFTDGYIAIQSGPVPVLNIGDQLTATGLAGKFAEGNRIRVRDTKELIGKDMTPPEAPIVNPVTDKDIIVSGTAEAGSTIVARVNGMAIGQATADAEGKYEIAITKQQAGTVISVSATDTAGNESAAVEIKVTDVTAPDAPVVNPVTDKDLLLSGTAEAGSTVIAKVNGTAIGQATADADGKYEVKIAKQTAGTVISVTATDVAGNESVAAQVIVMDVTAPDAPKVNEVKDYDKIITGTAEPGSTITIKVGTTVIGTGVTDQFGNFKVTITSIQKSKTILQVTATDQAGNVSSVTTIAVKDITPIVDPVTSSSMKVTGKGEPYSVIIIMSGSKILGFGIVDKNGFFTISIPKQKAGTVLTIYAVSVLGIESAHVNVTVQK